MSRRHAPIGRLRRIVPAAGSAVLVALTVVSCTSDVTEPPRTATVQKASVTTGVSATGSMSAITQQNMGFANGGQLTNVLVKVGDHVEVGQVLATVDDFAWRQTLAQQQGQLASQQAALDRLINSPVVDGAKDSADQAKNILDATRRQADAQRELDETSIRNAERQLDVDKKALDKAKDRLEADKKACRSSGGDDDDSDSSSRSGASSRSSGSSSGSSGSSSGSSGSSSESSESESSSESSGSSSGSTATPTSATSSSQGIVVRPASTSACSAIASDEQAVVSARQQVVSSQNSLDTARKQRDLNKASNDVAIENARQTVVSAENDKDSAESDRPFDIEEQRGAVTTAQAAVAAAQRDVDNATLRAPVSGTVSVINGVIGEYLAPSSGTSAQAPGSSAAIPGTGNGTENPAGAGAAGVATPTRPGGNQFLMLDNVDAFHVVVPFNESDAATIVPNQPVNILVDAVPDLTLTGTVLSVAPSGTDISGVVSYYATIVVNKTDPRLKDGQTVRATVVTQEIKDVLTVPSAAVRQENGRSVVTVVEGGNQTTVPIEPGVVGQDRTQVLSGLREGQQVMLPAAR